MERPEEASVPSRDSEVTLSLVIPAYNESETIEQTIEAVTRDVSGHCDTYEVIVVDDGSQDETPAIARRIAEGRPDVHFRASEQNNGKGHAIREGCLLAAGDVILLLDADTDLDSRRIATFLDRLRQSQADVVIGSKRHPDSAVAYPLKRRVLSRGYSILIRLLFGLSITDTQVGMKLFRREVAEDVMPLLLVDRYAYDVEFLALANRFGYQVTEAPVSLDFDGHSSIDWRAVLRIGWDTLSVFVRLNLLRSYEVMHRAAEYTRRLGFGQSEERGEQ